MRDDRQFGAMGGCSGISYVAMSAYASDHSICGGDLQIFTVLIKAMDAEYLQWLAERQEKDKPPPTDNPT